MTTVNNFTIPLLSFCALSQLVAAIQRIIVKQTVAAELFWYRLPAI